MQFSACLSMGDAREKLAVGMMDGGVKEWRGNSSRILPTNYSVNDLRHCRYSRSQK